jgi:transcription antitermination factor NusG
MSMQWYAVHTLSGSEDRAMKALGQRVQMYELDDRFGRVLVPSETVYDAKTKRTITFTLVTCSSRWFSTTRHGTL